MERLISLPTYINIFFSPNRNLLPNPSFYSDTLLNSCRSLKCARITIHMNLFASFAANNSLWLLWYRAVVPDPDVLAENKVIHLLFLLCFHLTLSGCGNVLIRYWRIVIANEAIFSQSLTFQCFIISMKSISVEYQQIAHLKCVTLFSHRKHK